MGQDDEKTSVPPLNERSDYKLWRIRLEAMCDAKELGECLTQEKNPYAEESDDWKNFEQNKKKASNFILRSLANRVLRILLPDVGHPCQMLKRLDERYDSKSTSTKIAKMTELVSIRYLSMRRDISLHIDQMSAIIDQLSSMGTQLPKELTVSLLMASIEAPDLSSVIAAIKTLLDDKMKWEAVASRLLEEQREFKSKHVIFERASAASSTGRVSHCEICEVDGHPTSECFWNPNNPSNKLHFKFRRNSNKKPNKDKNFEDQRTKQDSEKDIAKSRKKENRNCVARAAVAIEDTSDEMLLDSGTTSHMLKKKSQLTDSKRCNVQIALGDDSKITASHKGVRKMTWSTKDVDTEVSLSNTLCSKELAMNLLSIPALAKARECTLFLPSVALLMDMDKECKLIGRADRYSDGLYYIAEKKPVRTTDQVAQEVAFCALVRDLVESTDSGCSSDNTEASSRTDSIATNTSVSPPLSDSCESVHDWKEHELSPPFDQDTVSDMISTGSEQELENYTVISKTNEERQSPHIKSKLVNKSTSSEGSGQTETAAVPVNEMEVVTWHKRFGHQGSKAAIKTMIQECILPHCQVGDTECEPCLAGKLRRSYKSSISSAEAPGHLHIDAAGKMKQTSVHGENYIITIIDEVSRYVYGKAVAHKSDASPTLLTYSKWFERQVERSVKTVHSDGGKEVLQAQRKLRDNGVEIDLTSPYSPASNGMVERAQGLILNAARTSLYESKIPLKFWPYAVQHVIAGKNALPHNATGISPHEALSHTCSPHIKHARAFGCKVHYLLDPGNKSKSDKFAPLMGRGINLGHDKGGIYFILTPGGIVRTKHATFDENSFPGMKLFLNIAIAGRNGNGIGIESKEKWNFKGSDSDSSHRNDAGGMCSRPQGDENSEEDISSTECPLRFPRDLLEYRPPVEIGQDQDTEDTLTTHGNIRNELYTRPAEQRCQSSEQNVSTRRYNLRPRTNVAQPDSISTHDEPSLKDALCSDEQEYWRAVVAEEFETLISAGTWEQSAEALPTDEKSIPSGFILRLKRDAAGKPARFKARLVARGNMQSYRNVSADSFYAPVVCFEIVRVFLIVSSAFGWSMEQMDMKGACLYADLPKETPVWIRLPKIQGDKWARGQIVKLKKSLYGLRQAPKLWYKKLVETLKSIGFTQSVMHECLFTLSRCSKIAILVCYIDDLAIFGDKELIQLVKRQISQIFDVTQLGKLSYFLGVKIKEEREYISLSQPGFTQKIIDMANLSTAKPTPSTLPMGHVIYEKRKVCTKEEIDLKDNVPYREVLGSLLYLCTRTRPDISAAVSMLGKLASSPAPRHWKAMKYLVRYLVGTSNHGMRILKSTKQAELRAYSDSDWARDEDKRKSRSGIVLLLNDCPFIWSSKLQSCVALSSSEAEFIALSSCVRNVAWARALLAELGFGDSEPTIIYQDNLGAIKWTTEVTRIRHVKHIAIKYNHVRESVELEETKVVYVPSAENKADSLTKALRGLSAREHREFLRVVDVTSRGRVRVSDSG